jgi:predicted dehydrogenase
MWNVLVIGVGNIAQGFDEPESSFVKTHLKGYLFFNKYFEVTDIFDLNKSLVEHVGVKWGITNCHNDFQTVINKKYNVISICTPDNTHEYYLEKAILMKPDVIFIEKPIGVDFSKAKKIFDYCLANNILLITNYSRIFLNDFNQLKTELQSGLFGKVLSINIKYHKGFYHNCSHFINLIIFLLQPEYVNSFVVNSFVDYSDQDPSISGIARLRVGEGYEFLLSFEAFDHRILNMTEVDILTEEYRIVYWESKGSWLKKIKKKNYFGGIELKEYVEESVKEIDYNYAMINAIDLIRKHLENKEKETISNYANIILTTTEIMEAIKKNNF